MKVSSKILLSILSFTTIAFVSITILTYVKVKELSFNLTKENVEVKTDSLIRSVDAWHKSSAENIKILSQIFRKYFSENIHIDDKFKIKLKNTNEKYRLFKKRINWLI